MVNNNFNNAINSIMSVLAAGLIMVSFSLESCSRDETQRLYLHRRSIIMNGNDSTKYLDYLTLTNYRDHPKSAMELFRIATKYLDTVHSDLEVAGITILDKNDTDKIRFWDSETGIKERPYIIIDFFFKQYNRYNGEAKERPLNSISFFKKGKVLMYYQHYFNKPEPDKQLLDSILNSPIPIMPDR